MSQTIEISQKTVQQERPMQVTTAVYLLYAALVIGLLGLFDLPGDVQTQNISATFIAQWVVLFTAMIAFIYYMILRGKNWTRIIFLVFFVSGVIMDMLGPKHPLHIVSLTIQTIIGVAAVILLFLPSSSQWFRQVKDTRMKQAYEASIKA